MKQVELPLDLDVGLTPKGDLCVYVWLGDDYADPIEISFGIQDIFDRMHAEISSPNGVIHADYKDDFLLSVLAFEEKIHIAIDSIHAKNLRL